MQVYDAVELLLLRSGFKKGLLSARNMDVYSKGELELLYDSACSL